MYMSVDRGGVIPSTVMSAMSPAFLKYFCWIPSVCMASLYHKETRANHSIRLPIWNTITASTQAMKHCQKTTPIAYPFPSSRLMAAMAATHGV